MSELYYIALVPDQKLSQLCLEYKLMAKESFQTQATLRSIAHITLVAPFKADDLIIEQIRLSLARIINQYTELNLILSGWNHFEERTIYLGCKTTDKLTKLYTECQNTVNQLIKRHQEKRFVPHISIINRDLAQENFADAWGYFSTQEYPTQTTCSQLVIFKHSPQNWQIDQSWNLIPQGNNNA